MAKPILNAPAKASAPPKASSPAKTNAPVVHPYFVVIHYPREFRRTLLEASRDIIYSLQRHQKLKLLREEKKKEILRLRDQVKEVNFLFSKLQEQLPPSLLMPRDKEPSERGLERIAPKHPVPAKREENELDQLSKHLSDIEGRLSKL